MKSLQEQIREVIEPSLAADGFGIVQISLVDGNNRKTVQILVENMTTGRITLDEIASISRTASALLDVQDVIQTAYNLEVSSPGIDRPLIRTEDYVRYAGFEAKIDVSLPVNGRRRFKGQLIGISDEGIVTIRIDNEDHAIALSNIRAAKLVLTDALIKAQAPKIEDEPVTELS